MMANKTIAGCALLVSFLMQAAQAASVTIREINVKNSGTEILLDSAVDKKTIDVDYVRDIVQFSINNATIYPAKMIHAEKASFTKVFAYQYSPSLVRIRFSVDQNAEKFKGQLKWGINGKTLSIQFPELKPEAITDEKSLLEKITAAVDGKEEPKKELKKDEVRKNEATFSSEKTGTPLTGAGKKSVKLGGAKSGPSVFRSLFAMMLVVGGLGMVLIYVKRRNSGAGQAKKVNQNSWLGGIFGQAKSQKPLMEVLATHVLGPKQSIVVMKIKGQQFVLAVTAENIQLITQLDSDDSELDLLDDPKVAASLGKMFGVSKNVNSGIQKELDAFDKPEPSVNVGSSFNAMLKNSNGAGAIIARNAYATENKVNSPEPAMNPASRGGAIEQIRRRLGNMQ